MRHGWHESRQHQREEHRKGIVGAGFDFQRRAHLIANVNAADAQEEEDGGRAVPVDTIIDRVWGETPGLRYVTESADYTAFRLTVWPRRGVPERHTRSGKVKAKSCS